MSYTKITTSFKDHETVLTAAHLQHMENGIADNDAALMNRVRTDVSNQGLSAAQKSNARMNIDTPSNAELTAAVAAEADLRSAADAAMETKTDGIQEEVDQAKEDISDLQSVSSSLVKTKTAKGNPITIKDALAGKAKKLVINLEPKQNLNGYSKPWLGGSGKNLCPNAGSSITTEGITYTVNADGSIKINGTAANTAYLYISPTEGVSLKAGTYTRFLRSDKNFSGVRMQCRIGSAAGADLFGTGAEAQTATINEGTVLVVRIIVTGGKTIDNVTFYPMIVSGTYTTETFPAWEPYSNICPIEGFDTVQVVSTGRNLFDKNNLDPTPGYLVEPSALISSSGNYRVSNWIRVDAGEKYTVSNGTARGESPSYAWYDENRNLLQVTYHHSGGFPQTYTAPPGAYWLRESVHVNDLDTFMLEKGATASSYEPFGNAISLNLITSAGSTVYGGTVTVNEDGSGTLVVDRAKTILPDNVTLQYSTSTKCFYTTITPVAHGIVKSTYTSAFSGTSNKFLPYPGSNIVLWQNAAECYVGYGYANDSVQLYEHLRFSIPHIDITDLETAKSIIADTEVLYDLETPLTYPLTAAQLQTLLGTNHIWTDGTSLELDYQADKYGNMEKLLAAFPKEIVTGNPTSFTDGADGIPVESLTVAIEPKQDLHGYNHPWVGGAGKNLCPLLLESSSKGGVIYTVNANGTVTFSGTQNQADTIDVYFHRADGNNNFSSVSELPAGNYRFSLITGGSNSTYRGYAAINESGEIRYVGINSGYGEFTLTAFAKVVIFLRFFRDVTVSNLVAYPMIYAANAGDAFEPFENICPITGHDRVTITRHERNLWDDSKTSYPTQYITKTEHEYLFKAISSGAEILQLPFPIEKDGTYSLSFEAKSDGAGNARIIFDALPDELYPSSSEALGRDIHYNVTNVWTKFSATGLLRAGTTQLRLYRTSTQTNAGVRKISVRNIQIEASFSVSDYVPHEDAQTQVCSLNPIINSPVYGGLLTIDSDGSGTLTVNKGMYAFTGTETFTESSTNGYMMCGSNQNSFMSVFDIPNAGDQSYPVPVVSHFNGIGYAPSSSLSVGDSCTFIGTNNKTIGFYTWFNEPSEFKAWLSEQYQVGNPVTVVLPLETPATYPLTAQAITTLLGTNHITCDAGEVTVTYRADPTLLINKLVSVMTAYGITV